MGGDDDRAHTVARLNSVRRQSDSARAEPRRVDEFDDPQGEPPIGQPQDGVVRPDPEWLLPAAQRPESPWSSLLPQRWRFARVDPGRPGVKALAAAGVFVVLVAGFAVFRDAPTPAPAPPLAVVSTDAADARAPDSALSESGSSSRPPDRTAGTAPVAETELVVSVVGLVAHPGLVRLQPGSRIADALAAAGGAVEGADLLALNMAARVSDGDQIVVGLVPAPAAPPVSGTTSGQGAGPGGVAGSTTDQAGPAAGGAVDLNTATVAELDALPGVGPVTATSIVSWRDTNGRFVSVDQLAEVDGIGPGRLTKIRELVRVS